MKRMPRNISSIIWGLLFPIIGSIIFSINETTDQFTIIDFHLLPFSIIFNIIYSFPFLVIGVVFLKQLIVNNYSITLRRSIIYGGIIGGITIVIIFLTGASLLACIGSHGKCESNPPLFLIDTYIFILRNGFKGDFLQSTINRFYCALPIAIICGTISGCAIKLIVGKIKPPNPAQEPT